MIYLKKKYDLAKPQTKTWSLQRAFFVSLDSNRVKTMCWVSQRSFQCSATFRTENKPSNGNHVLFDGDIFMKCFELSPLSLPGATALPEDYCGVTTTLFCKKSLDNRSHLQLIFTLVFISNRITVAECTI